MTDKTQIALSALKAVDTLWNGDKGMIEELQACQSLGKKLPFTCVWEQVRGAIAALEDTQCPQDGIWTKDMKSAAMKDASEVCALRTALERCASFLGDELGCVRRAEDIKAFLNGKRVSVGWLTSGDVGESMKEPLKTGDIITISGRYKPRTFWQWLTRQPRELEKWGMIE